VLARISDFALTAYKTMFRCMDEHTDEHTDDKNKEDVKKKIFENMVIGQTHYTLVGKAPSKHVYQS
jgi:hypothetical protein